MCEENGTHTDKLDDASFYNMTSFSPRPIITTYPVDTVNL